MQEGGYMDEAGGGGAIDVPKQVKMKLHEPSTSKDIDGILV